MARCTRPRAVLASETRESLPPAAGARIPGTWVRFVEHVCDMTPHISRLRGDDTGFWASFRRHRVEWVIRICVLVACVATLVLQAISWLTMPRLTIAELLLFAAMTMLAVLFLLYCLRELYVERVERELERARRLEELNGSVIRTLAIAINSKDRMSQGHLERVQISALAIAREMGVEDELMEALRIAALLHDIGKLAVPEHILNKPERLTEEEERKVQSHTRVGRRILEPIRFPYDVVPIVEHHHEAYDGSGYPDGQQGVEIPLGARILAVANVYDALVSMRPYRAALPHEEAMAHIAGRSGIEFDPDVVAAFLGVTDKGGLAQTYSALTAAREAKGAIASGSIHDDIASAQQELFALYDIAQTMSTTLNVQETLGLIAGKTKKVVNYSTFVVFLIDRERNVLRAEFVRGVREEDLAGLTIPLGEGISGKVAATGIPMRSDDPGRDLEFGRPGPSGAGLLSVLVLPLMREREIIGAIALYHSSKGAFTEDHQRLLSIVARQASMAIEHAREFERTKESALTDNLTGLPNARCLYMLLEQELSRAQRQQQPFSLLAMDLDDFKSINDTFGHQAGDETLRDLARIFQHAVREYDMVARHAGDEFFVVLPATGREQAGIIANRIQAAVDEHRGRYRNNTVVRLRVSVGLATYPEDAQDVHSLVAAADAAMYADKRANQQQIQLVAR
jgi:diguanylate cyclase (GGDEF)-like protein/putative nucleotidyltransferase with HDIG domain